MNRMILLAALALTAPTADAAPGTRRYVIEAPSEANARVAFFGLANRKASFPKVAGTVAIDPASTAAISIDVTLDAAALVAGDTLTRDRLKGPAFFDVARTREVRFVGGRMRLTDPIHAAIDGTLTARGTSRPVTLAVTFSQPVTALAPGAPLHLTGSTTIDRTSFGMTAYPLIVGRKVAIDLDITLRAQP